MITRVKTWGREEWLVNRELYCAKRLYVTAGFQCSLHRHRIKDETFVVETGSGFIRLGDNYVAEVKPGDVIHVPPLMWHLFGSKLGMQLLEVSTHHDDADVERKQESGAITNEPSKELAP